MPLTLSERALEYLSEAVVSCQQVRTMPELYMWVQGPLWAFLPHDVMLFCVADSASQWVLADCLHSQPLKGQVVNALIDRQHGLLAKLIVESRGLSTPMLYMNVLGQSAQPLAPDLRKALLRLKLGGVWFADSGALPGFHRQSFALLGAKLDTIEPGHLAWIAPAIQAALSRVAAHQQPVAGAPADAEGIEPEVLTARQQEIIKWVRQGKTNAEIGDIMGISAFTVKNHLQKIFKRLQVNNRAQAVSVP
jgi:transcriptional regulator EpsA